jgi:hypothetical protein
MADALVQFREGHNCPLRYGQESGGGGSSDTPPTAPVITGITEAEWVSGTVQLGATADADAVDFRTETGGTFATGQAPDFTVDWDTTTLPNGQVAVLAVAWKGGVTAAGPMVHVTINN